MFTQDSKLLAQQLFTEDNSLRAQDMDLVQTRLYVFAN